MAKKQSTPRRPSKRSQSGDAAEKKTWTVMVYMAAGKDLQTELAAISDIKEMEAADTTNVNVVVLLDRDWPVLPQIYRIVNGMSVPICPKDLADEAYSLASTQTRKETREAAAKSNTGDPKPLTDFIDWVLKDRVDKDEHFFLVLWGHNFGLGFGRDHNDPLTLPELKDALDTFGKGKLTILGANTCAMSYAEAAFELRNSADYLVASQIAVPLTGWPYTTILSRIAAEPQIEPRALGKQIVLDFVASLEEDDASMALLDLNAAEALAQPLKKLAAALVDALNDDETKDQVVDAFLDTAHGDVRPLVDLGDLCTNLSSVSDDAVRGAAKALKKVTAKPGKLVLEHEFDPKLEGLHGLGIFAPGVTGEADLKRLEVSEKSYQGLKLVDPKDNEWSRVAFSEMQGILRPMQESVAEFVRSAGASTREDRTGLAQLVVSIDRTFKKLDRALADTKQTVKKAFDEVGKPKDAPTSLTLPPRFGPPFLLLSDAVPALDPASAKKRRPARSNRTSSVLESVAQSLANLEHALADAERTARRVLTHSRLGLGDDPGSKPGVLGDDPGSKPGVLGDDPGSKPGVLGDDPGSKPGVLGLLSKSVGDLGRSPSTSGVSGLVEMYGQVASALRLLEDSVGRLEQTVRSALTMSAAAPDVRDLVSKQTDRVLREVEEMITSAKLVTRGVMVDPADGLGPGAQSSIRGIGREQLAIAGGLSSKFLRLL